MKEAGFTLLEVLVASMVAALALGVLFGGAAGGVRSARVAGHVQEATARAQSRLTVLEHGPAPQPGESEGADGGGFRFRQFVTAVARAPGLALYDLAVTSSWNSDGGEREVTLRSRRVMPAPPETP